MTFEFTDEKLAKLKATATLKEIAQQPDAWLKVAQLVESKKDTVVNFLTNGWFKKDKTRIVFTGAGTSEFVGSSLAHGLVKAGYDAVSIATTDIVSDIEYYLDKNKSTLLVSFARSGNSPESVATFDMVSDVVVDVRHIVITCNKDGALAKRAQSTSDNLVMVLPDETNDKSFAMTSSFSSMLLCAYLIFNIDTLSELTPKIAAMSSELKKATETQYNTIKAIAESSFDRIVYLGSGDFKGIAQESHLKMLELTAGMVSAHFDSPLGFRHGPKSILNQDTLVVIYLNQDSYIRQYDLDLLHELWAQKQTPYIVVVSNDPSLDCSTQCWKEVVIPNSTGEKTLVGLSYIFFAQLVASLTSIKLQISPDNPCSTGEVNRVVQGVTIHKYQK